MQLTKFTDLGLRVVMRVATPTRDGAPLTTRIVAEQIAASYAHTAKVVARLESLGVVVTRRGRHGGLAITDLGRTANVGWLVRHLEGVDEVIECEGDTPCPFRQACTLRGVLRDAQEAFFRVLDGYTVADIASPPLRQVLLTLGTPPPD